MFQSIEGFGWILGLGFMFGLSFFMTQLTNKDIKTFFVFLTIFNSFMVWCGILELWTLIVNIIIVCLIMVSELKGGKV